MASATEQRTDQAPDHLEPFNPAEKRLGTVVGGTYRLKRLIGSGGSSHVFEAEHLRLGKPFAVKLLRPELDANRRTAQRFRREARAIAHLKSEHIVSVIDCGELEDGTPYLVMELLEGEDLRSLLNREGTLPARRAVPLIIEACRGLSEVHAAGLVHRDLKPENLFITRRSTGEDWCKVLDFGVAKMEASLATARGAIVGTLRYMAPEQLEASSSVGPTTDIYALGAILYECLCSDTAHPGDTAQEVMYSVMNRAAAEAPLNAARVPRPLIDVVAQCLSKDPQSRPADVRQLIRLLSRQIAAASEAVAFATISEGNATVQNSRPAAKDRGLSPVFWTLVAAAIAVTALTAWMAPDARPQRLAPLPLRAEGSRVPRAATAASAIPAQSTPPPALVESPKASASVPAPRPRERSQIPNRAAPTAAANPSTGLSFQPQRAAVGSFDAANPYGE